MNHCVPDFEIQVDDDEEYPISLSSGLPRPKKPSVANDEIMELLWENGQVVMQSQNQRPFKKPPPPASPSRNIDGVIPVGPSSAREIRLAELENYHNQHLFMQEDEMTSWLQYSIDEDPPMDHNFCADLLYPPTTVSRIQHHNSTMQTPAGTPHATELRHLSRSVPPGPPIPPTRRPEQVLTKIQNFAHFSKHNARAEPGPSSSLKTVARESTVVDSCDTPVVTAAVASRASETVRCSAELTEGDTGRGSMSTAGTAVPSTALAGGGTVGREKTTFEMTVTSSPSGSSGSAEPAQRPAVEDRKRKGREAEESEFQSEDVNFESGEAKKQVRGSTTTKRSRAAEVHNLSERRRRDRINEKMKALQELIPWCNKSDKASMLDEAIEYLKSLQLQVQMMSMGCGMVPMMFLGIQQYMTPMGMGIGMGMGMEMGINRPVMPFPNMLVGSALPAATAAAPHLGARFPMPPFAMPRVPPAPNSSSMQVANQSADNMITSLGTPDPDQLRIPNFTDPYLQYFGPHQMQLQLMPAINQPNVSKPSTSRGQENPEKHQSEEI